MKSWESFLTMNLLAMVFLITGTNCPTSHDTSRKQGSCGEHTNKDLRMALESHWLSWHKDEKPPVWGWLKSHCCTIPRATFAKHLNKSSIVDVDSKQTDDHKKLHMKNHVNKLTASKLERGVKIGNGNGHLTDNEEQFVVSQVLVLASSGNGCSKPDMLALLNECINFGENKMFKRYFTEQMHRMIERRHSKVMKIVNSCSLNPLRTEKATKMTRDQAFAKMWGWSFVSMILPVENCQKSIQSICSHHK